MEVTKNEAGTGPRLGAVYTLEKSKVDLGDRNFFLHKNGRICKCPHLSSTVPDARGGAVLEHPCGEFCQFFNLVPEMDSVKKEPTGCIRAVITCGSLTSHRIANFQIDKNGSPAVAPGTPPASHITVTK